MAEKQPLPLRERAFRETKLMVEHALATGKMVPVDVVQLIDKIELQKLLILEPQNQEYISRAASYEALGAVSDVSLLAELTMAHNTMSGIIAPLTPEQILSTKRDNTESWLRYFGSVALVRHMSIIVIICVLLFVGLFTSDLVDSKSINGNILDYNWPDFLLNQAFLLSMAAMGAGFYNLFEAYKYITEGSFDTKYTNVYWIRFTLGIVAGIILSQFIFVEAMPEGSSVLQTAKDAGINLFAKPLLAFLGGFSSRVVYKILNRLVDALETFVDGSARDIIEARNRAAREKLDQTISNMRAEYLQGQNIERINAMIKLMNIKERINNGDVDKNEFKLIIDSILNDQIQNVNTPSVPTTIQPPTNLEPPQNHFPPSAPATSINQPTIVQPPIQDPPQNYLNPETPPSPPPPISNAYPNFGDNPPDKF